MKHRRGIVLGATHAATARSVEVEAGTTLGYRRGRPDEGKPGKELTPVHHRYPAVERSRASHWRSCSCGGGATKSGKTPQSGGRLPKPPPMALAHQTDLDGKRAGAPQDCAEVEP